MKSRLSLAVVLAAAVVLAGCGSDSDSAASGTPTIRVGNIPTSGLALLHLMARPPADLALANKGAYQLEVTDFSGSPDIQQGLATGTLDAGSVGAAAIFPALENGVDLKIAGEFFEERSGFLTSDWLVRKDSGIKTVSDLRGKTVATNSVGSPVYWTGKGHLDKAGLTADEDYDVVAVPFANMEQALAGGQVDIAPMIMPFAKAARDSGKYETLFKGTDELDPSVQSLMVFREEFIGDNPAAFKAFQADWATTADYFKDPANHDNVVKSVAAAMRVPEASLDYVGTQDFYYVPENGAPDVAAIQKLWDWFEGVGGISKGYDVEDYLVDAELLPQ